MKIAILAAGTSKYFPLFIDRPKCLYHLDGEIQLERVIKMAKNFVPEEDIIVIGGYKYKQIERFLKENYPRIELRVNREYSGPAVHTFRTAAENINDDMVFMLGDENISYRNVERICKSTKGMAIMCHDEYYYYSVGIMKVRKDNLHIIKDDCYLSMDYMKEVYCFANQKKEYDGIFTINSGICLGYMFIDIVRRIGKIEKIENPMLTYKGEDVDFIHYDPKIEYIPDIDYIEDTDEYKESLILRLYDKCISRPLKWLIRLPGRVINKLKKIIAN